MLSLTLEEMNKEFDRYVREAKNEEMSKLISLYRDITVAQYGILERISMPVKIDKDELDNLQRDGMFLLSESPLPVDAATLHEAMIEIAEVIAKGNDDMTELPERLKGIEEFRGEKLNELLGRTGGLSPEMFVDYLSEHNIEVSSGVDRETLTFIYFSALTPFYVSYTRNVASRTDFGLWSHGYCPVCAQKPFMARLRKDDNARILECWLCHAQWMYPRLDCPFCDNNDHKKMRYFYIEEDKKRRVNVCENCKNYIKTAVEKEFGREVVLKLENLFTLQLDLVARREGYKPGEDLAVLN